MSEPTEGYFNSTVDLQDLTVLVIYDDATADDVGLSVYALDAGARKFPITDLLTENQIESLTDEVRERAL